MTHSELFVATHREASAFARGAGPAPAKQCRLPLGDLSEWEIEELGELAVQSARVSGVDTAFGLVDIDLGALSVVPEGVVEALALLLAREQQPEEIRQEENLDVENLDELARRWAKSGEVEVSAEQAVPLLRGICELAALVVAADEEDRLALYYLAR